jgi:hypothetical protein
VIDRRTVTGKELAKWRADIIRDIGGDPSTMERGVIDVCVTTKLLTDSASTWTECPSPADFYDGR